MKIKTLAKKLLEIKKLYSLSVTQAVKENNHELTKELSNRLNQIEDFINEFNDPKGKYQKELDKVEIIREKIDRQTQIIKKDLEPEIKTNR